ncbi:MAG: nucleotidyltransferase-like protein [Anaerobacillus sp.]|uniref:nucleotidyltransferase-like protein n=1 Tax=Anaerobacillus sp. TaxID=1872506 RepID=UPI003918BCA3
MDQSMNGLLEGKLDENALGLLRVENESTLDLDIVLIAITNKEEDVQSHVAHFHIGNKSVELQFFNAEQIPRILIGGLNRRLVDWLMNAAIIAEKDGYVTELRKKITQFPVKDRQHKIAVEFSKLIRRYADGKQLFKQEHFLDAFNSILHSLHHLARISVIEHGLYPEVTVWQQVKHLEPEIYKLYEEMVTGEEVLEKRIELLLIAINFAITSKTRLGATHLIEIMQEKTEPWSIEDLLNHDQLKEYDSDLVVLIEFLVQKGIIDIVKVVTEENDVFLRLYLVK